MKKVFPERIRGEGRPTLNMDGAALWTGSLDGIKGRGRENKRTLVFPFPVSRPTMCELSCSCMFSRRDGPNSLRAQAK